MNNDLNVLLKIVNAPAFFPSLHNQKIDYDYDQTYVLNLSYVMVMEKKSLVTTMKMERFPGDQNWVYNLQNSLAKFS